MTTETNANGDGTTNTETEVTTGPSVEQQIADTVTVDQPKVSENLDALLDQFIGAKPSEATKTGKEKEVQGKSATTTTNAPGTQTQEGQPKQQQQERTDSGNRRPPVTPRAYPKAYRIDANNNVVDAATGNVLALAGGQRSHFERVMLPYIEGMRARADKAEAALDASTKANTLAASLNLTPDEYALGSRIMAAWKSDPKKALNFLLTEAQQNGIDVSDIVSGGGGVSIPAITAAMEAKISKALEPFLPFVQEREAARLEREREDTASTAVDNLLAEYPDAELHGEHIAAIMQHHVDSGKDITMREAYLILRNHALQSGLDWTKPLRPQVQALEARKNGNGSTTTAPNVDTRRAPNLPNMTGRGDNGVARPAGNGSMPGVASSKDIVREAMRENGIMLPD